MFKKLMNKKMLKNEKGLTLIELLAVIVILAIVAAIAIPAIGNIIDNSRVKAAKADAANVLSAANIYFTENTTAETFTNDTNATAGWEAYITDLGSIDKFTVTKGKLGTTGETPTEASPAKVATKGAVSSKKYTITATSLKELQLDKGDEAEDNFDWDK